jgi:predicted XRE-type DNA-binding protein
VKKARSIVVRDAEQLAEALGLSPADAVEMQVRRRLNDKIVTAVRESGLTHADVARAAGTSRSRVTSIVNRDTANVSTDLLLRILVALGYRANITFTRRRAA